MTVDFVLRQQPGMGWEGFVILAFHEEYRTAQFHQTPESALQECKAAAAKMWGEA